MADGAPVAARLAWLHRLVDCLEIIDNAHGV
jgi:hypothetical protein